ncbi:unnamed protein product [Larinioides sclopetarius]|uniref:PHD and RING finger domain-containing protein 1 n=1 Tax=Larinioides sclopetarius TaxID=280406 RepID=A0AAV2BIG3_9ARAC
MSEAGGSGIYDAEYSDSDSDDESETGLSEESDSDSSDGSGIEEDDDDITEESQIVDVQEASGISSDEGGEKESCPICLNRFIGQDLGIPESCDHIFCLECIREWAKNINTCPIDRTEFNYVNLKSTPNGKILKKIKVKVQPKEPENALQQEATLCEVCHLGDREDRLLLCDACDLAYHCECLDPPLFHVPIEEWFCPPCSGILQNGAVAGPSVSRSRRVIPRTRASENVRTRVQDRRTRPAITRSPSASSSKSSARSVNKRISKHLGLIEPSTGGSIPDVKSKTKSSSKSIIPTSSPHYLFGNKNQLMDFNESFHEDAPGPSRRQQEVVASQPSSSLNILDSIMAGQKILHTKANDVIIKTDGSLVLKENKTKEKGISKKPLGFQKAKEKEVVKKLNPSEKEKGAIKKSNFYDNTKDQCRGIIKKSDVSNKAKSSRVTFGEPSNLGAIPKAQKHSERKPSPMLLAALARRRENEMSNQSVSDYKSSSSSSLERNATSVDSLQHSSLLNQSDHNLDVQTNIDKQKNSKQLSSSLKTKTNKNSSSYEAVNKSSNYSHESSFNKSVKANPIKSFDNTQNSDLSDSNSDYMSFSCIEPKKSRVKYETKNIRPLFKSENVKESPKHSCLSPKQELDNVSRLHDGAFSCSLENSRSARQSCTKNENMSSKGCMKKIEIQKFIKKEETNDILSEKLTVANSSPNTTILTSSETEINYADEDTMELISSQSLIQGDSDVLLTSFRDTKQLSFDIKKEPSSFSEKSDSECSQSLVEPLQKLSESNSQTYHKSLNDRTSNLKLKIKEELESSDDDCQSPNNKNNLSFNKSHNQTINTIMDDDDDTVGFEDSQSIITQTVAEMTAHNGQTFKKRHIDEINSSGDETNICHVSNSYSQTKFMDDLRNNKNVSEDFSKIKIKEEPSSSEDEESCSLLTDDLPFTQLAGRNNLPYPHLKDPPFSCTQGINSPFNEQVDDLPCTQLAETICDKKAKSLYAHSSKSPLNKLEDDLPCAQPVKILDDLEEDSPHTQLGKLGLTKSRFRKDDLPSSHFVKPAPVNYLSKKEGHLQRTQSSSPLSNMQIDDLPCTQLLKPSSAESFSIEKEDALTCTQLAKPVSNMEMDGLHCTQFVVPAPIKDIFVKEEDELPDTRPSSPMSQMQTDDLPCTQLVEPSSKNTISKEEGALSCMQLARPVSGMEINIQMDDLPTTPFVALAPVKYSCKRKIDSLMDTQLTNSLSQRQMDDLPCTQLVEPSSNNCASIEEDALPCTQLVKTSSKIFISDEEDDFLPCTQIAKSISSMEMDDLPCTQLARPLSSKHMDDLPNPQFVMPAPVKCPSKKTLAALPATLPSISLSQIQMDDLPCTQAVEFSSIKSFSDKEEDSLPCTQLARHISSMEMDDLPCAQLVKPLSKIQMDDLPSTQLVVSAPVKNPSTKEVNALPAAQPNIPHSQIQVDDLPCTQSVESSSVKSLPDKEEDSLPYTQLAKPISSMEMEDLPCTQLAKPLSSMQMNDLRSPQFVVPASAKCPSKKTLAALPATLPSISVSQKQMDDLPCTQAVEFSSIKSFSDKEDSLPCTQLARPNSSMEINDLPCTQLARPLSRMQMDDLPSTQLVASAPMKSPTKKVNTLPTARPYNSQSQMQMDDLPCTQLVEPSSVKSLSDKEDSLPCTQLATSMSNLHSQKSQNDHHVQNLPASACSEKLECDAESQTKQKQSGNFLEAENHNQHNLRSTQANTNINSLENSENLSNLNSNFDDDFDLPETQPLTLDQNHLKSKKLLQEKYNDEQVADEKLLSNIDKLKIKRPPKRKVEGVHKNLPQVLMPIPSRQIPIPKPSNRKTFSFDQVKQQYDAKDNKNTLHENISHGRMLALTKIGDLSTKQKLSSVLKEEQVSSECKPENPNNFKSEKSLFLDEPEILVSSIANYNFEAKMDKSNEPADSEIEIINDNKIMRVKNVDEVVLSSDEEDLPATQFIDRISDQCPSLPSRKRFEGFSVPVKRELNNSTSLPKTQQSIAVENSVDGFNANGNNLKKIVVKKEIALDDFEVENVKTLNSLSVKQEKCEETILKKIKMEPLQQLKTKEKVSRLIKHENKSHDSADITAVKSKSTNQKMPNTKNINNNANRWVRSHEEHVSKTDIADHKRNTVRDRSSSSGAKVKLEKERKGKTESSSVMKIHSKAVNKTESENRSFSKSDSNSNIKLNTESVNQIKLVSKDKTPKREHISSSHTHAKGECNKEHKLNTEKCKTSSKEANYHEESKRRKHSLDESKKVQDHKKLKMDSLTIKNEPTTDKNGKHSFEKSFNKKDTHEFKNTKIVDNTRQKSLEISVKTEKMFNLGKVKETFVSNDGKSRNDNKAAKVHSKIYESQNSNKSSSEMNSKVAHSSSYDKKKNYKYVSADNKCKEFGNIPFNDIERLNGRIKGESGSEKVRIKGEFDSEKKVNNRLKESKTNFKNGSTRTGSEIKRSDSLEGERNAKRPRLENLSCNEDTSDSHSDYSRSSKISSESNFRKKYKHQRNALNTLNEIADEIVSTSKNCEPDKLNQDENVDFEEIKKSRDISSLGRKVDKAHLKDEIAAEVKIALKPFYTVGLIDKEDYKDIMRKAVPKIFMNCGNYVHPEKIKNLVTSYVKKLTNS